MKAYLVLPQIAGIRWEGVQWPTSMSVEESWGNIE